MGSINRWLKSLLFACATLALFLHAEPVKAQTPPAPTYWGQQTMAVMNAYEADPAGWLTGLGFWTADDQPQLNYQLSVYLDFQFDGNGGQLSNLVRQASGTLSTSGYHLIGMPQLELELQEAFYVTLALSGAGVTLPKYGLSLVDFDDTGYQSDDYVYGETGGNWVAAFYDPESSNAFFAITPVIVQDDPNPPTKNIAVTAQAGDWSLTSQAYDAQVNDSLLTVALSATNDGPHDMEITVTGDMNPITVDGTVTNATGSDWLNGYCIQLGYGLGNDFVLATDGLAFGGAGGPVEVFFADLINAGDPVSVPGGFVINLGDSNVFTIRQFAVPEPGSLGLLAFCGLALLALRRRR